jgi:hypothetical protein
MHLVGVLVESVALLRFFDVALLLEVDGLSEAIVGQI